MTPTELNEGDDGGMTTIEWLLFGLWITLMAWMGIMLCGGESDE